MRTLEKIFEIVGFVVCMFAFMVFTGWVVTSIFDFFIPDPVPATVSSDLTWQTVDSFSDLRYQVLVSPVSENREDGIKTTVSCTNDYAFGVSDMSKDPNTIEITCEKIHDR